MHNLRLAYAARWRQIYACPGHLGRTFLAGHVSSALDAGITCMVSSILLVPDRENKTLVIIVSNKRTDRSTAVLLAVPSDESEAGRQCGARENYNSAAAVLVVGVAYRYGKVPVSSICYGKTYQSFQST